MKKLVVLTVLLGMGLVLAKGVEAVQTTCMACGCNCEFVEDEASCSNCRSVDGPPICQVVEGECVNLVGSGCRANMEKNSQDECVCSHGFSDCDGNVTNGCETEGFCFGCSTDSDCSWCGITCKSGVPAGINCLHVSPIGTCGCVDGVCTSSDGCRANQEKDANGDCVCSLGYSDCDEDSSNGCEVKGKCGCESNTDCFWCGADCVAGLVDDGRTCPAHKGDDVCGCNQGKCGIPIETVCEKNMKPDGSGGCKCGEPKGDYDGDKNVGVLDLVGWYKGYKNSDKYEDYEAADFDCSGQIDIQDLIAWYRSYRNQAAKADLVVEDISIKKVGPPNMAFESYFYIVRVKNVGLANADMSRVEVKLSPQQPQGLESGDTYKMYDGANMPIPNNNLIKSDYLAPGEVEEVSDYFNPSVAGNVVISAKADMENVVDESNEDNNAMEKTFAVDKISNFGSPVVINLKKAY